MNLDALMKNVAIDMVKSGQFASVKYHNEGDILVLTYAPIKQLQSIKLEIKTNGN